MANLPLSGLNDQLSNRPRAVRMMVPFVLGAVAALGHDGLGVLPVLAAFALAGLLLPQAARPAAGFGWLLGLGYFAITLRWIVEPFLVDVPRHGWMAPFAIVLMAGGLALFWALAFWAARRIAAGPTVALWLAVTMTAAELLRGHVLSGFPWGLVSYALIGGAGDIWFAWIGPFGASGLVFGVAGVLAMCLVGWGRWMWFAAGAVPVAILALHSLSAVTLPTTDQTVRLIQPNAPQHQKWDPDWMGVFYNRALDQTRAGVAPDVVIWPETSIPTLLEYADPLIADMAEAARGAPLVAGIQRRTSDAFYNSAILIDGPATVTALSDKTHLVPFGEYIPMAWLLEPLGLGTLVDQVAGFSPGEGDGLMQIDGLGLARVLICYEGIFPEEMQRTDVRPDILLILTNDAWFGNNAGPRQHLVQARARAIEQGLPVIRAANTGISAVIDARGQVVDSLALNTAGYLQAKVPGALPATVYARLGDWPLAIILAVALVAGGRRRKR